MLLLTRILLLITHTIFLTTHVLYTHHKKLTYIFLNLTIFLFYHSIKRKDAKRYFHNFSTRIIKYYNALVALIFGINYLPTNFYRPAIAFVVFYIVSDLLRVLIYEYTQNVFFTKMVSPYQLLIMKFEVVLQNIKNMHQLKINKIEMLKDESAVFKYFVKNYKFDVMEEKVLFDILSGSIKLIQTDALAIKYENSESEVSHISSETESSQSVQPEPVVKGADRKVFDVLVDLNAFPDLFTLGEPDINDADDDTIDDESLSLNFSPDVRKLVLNLFQYYDKDPIMKRNFSNYYKQYVNERTNLHDSIENCYKLFSTYNFISTILQILILSAIFMIGLEIQPKIISIFMAVFSFAFFPSLVEIVENFIMLILNHPIDCGDRVYYQNENYIVSNINLFCTVFMKWNGEFVIVDNTLIGKESIQNVKRSKKMSWAMCVYVHRNTSDKEMEKIIESFKEYCEFYVGKCAVNLDEIQGLYAKYNFYVDHGANFQNGYFMWRVHNKYTLYLKELFRVNKIEHIMPQMSVHTTE